jgi:Kef-type K+ transport system membrane component KefB
LKLKSPLLERSQFAPILHSAILVGFVAGGSYGGLSPLFAAFLAGILSTYFAPTSANYNFVSYYEQVLQRVLAPFFFASIGFAIPIKSLWTFNLVWRGIIYSALQFIAKGIVCIWVVIWDVRAQKAQKVQARDSRSHKEIHETGPSEMPQDVDFTSPVKSLIWTSMILSFAMISRGEIGFLIASLAESRDVFSREDSRRASELFLLTIWALFICTILGPLGVGLTVRRIKGNPIVALGTWG